MIYSSDVFLGFIDNRLQYLQLQIASTLKGFTKRSESYPIYEEFEELVNEINRGSPEGMNKGIS
jgi:hypothetical protein